MGAGNEAVLAAGRAANEAGRPGEAYRLLRPLADAGHAEAQAHVGALMAYGTHRFESYAEMNAAPELAVGTENSATDLAEGGRLLEAASAAGIGAASFNLAGLVVMGYGDGSWEERNDRAADLYALAYAQGFTHFAGLMNADGPGRPYLDIIEGHANDPGRTPPS